jgi:DsbC/DsbD-like thiol-disulfide interchange protein
MESRMRRAVFALCLLAAAPAAAEAPFSSAADAVTGVALLEGWSRPDGSRLAAVEIRLAPGWHTYWRVPGEAGIPPRFDWTGSRNLADVAYQWPRPQIFDSFGLRTFGYAEELVLPVVLTPTDADRPMQLALDLAFGVCADICVPAEARIRARLVPDAPPKARARIEVALAERPQTPEEAGVTRVTCRMEPTADGFDLTAEITFAKAPGPDQVAVVEPGQPGLWIGSPESRTDGRTMIARVLVEADGIGTVLARRDLRLTVLGARRAIDIRGCEAG